MDAAVSFTNLLCPGSPADSDLWEASWALKGTAGATAVAGWGSTSEPRASHAAHAGCITSFGDSRGSAAMKYDSDGYLEFLGEADTSRVKLALPLKYGASGKISIEAWVKATQDADGVIVEMGYGSGSLVTLRRDSATSSFRFVVLRSGSAAVSGGAVQVDLALTPD